MTRDEAFAIAAAALRGHEPALANEIENGCLRLHPGEPFFALRAQDVTASGCVDYWANINMSTAPVHKIAEAQTVADRMRRWQGPRKNAD